ncbi:MFS transporter [Saccharopolyspora sp. NPDC002686]|uniref:MFS transporter n=1 Tax=Saccharopolyspora sp. NPDC002686 TaxID=3154541 RepID=UPI00331DCB55
MPYLPAPGTALDDLPPSRFHYRVGFAAAGGMFIDGYILGAIAIALPLIPAGFGLTAWWSGLLGSSALIGLFLGGLVFGPITDRIGRKALYTADLTVFLIGSVLQFFATEPWQLFVIRLLIGVAIGADYAIGPALLSEFAPRRIRGPFLGSLSTVWAAGYIAALGVGIVFPDLGDSTWRWVLASSAVPSAIVLMLRVGLPESPRWLASKGRLDEALLICRQYLSPRITTADLREEPAAGHPYRVLFSARWRTRTLFAGGFWFARAWQNLAIYTFLPAVLLGLGVDDGALGSLVITSFWVVGGVVGMALINRIGRRPLLLWTMAIMTVMLVVFGAYQHAPAPIVVGLFILFSIVLSAGGVLEFTYPAELFPTGLRAAGAGIAAAVSRIGAALGTLVLPSIIDGFGVATAMYVSAAVCALGYLVSHLWAPETKGMTLGEASRSRPAAPTTTNSEVSGGA